VTVLRWLCIAAAALIIIGSLGPWREALGGIVTVSGTDNGGDGVFLIILAAFYAAAIGRHFGAPKGWLVILALLLAVLMLAITIADYGNVKDVPDESLRDAVTAGWGIWLAMLGSAAAAILALALWNVARAAARPADQ